MQRTSRIWMELQKLKLLRPNRWVFHFRIFTFQIPWIPHNEVAVVVWCWLCYPINDDWRYFSSASEFSMKRIYRYLIQIYPNIPVFLCKRKSNLPFPPSTGFRTHDFLQPSYGPPVCNFLLNYVYDDTPTTTGGLIFREMLWTVVPETLLFTFLSFFCCCRLRFGFYSSFVVPQGSSRILL